MKKLTFLTTAALAGTLALGTISQAQPDPNNTPKGDGAGAAQPQVTPQHLADWRKQNEARRKEWREKATRDGMTRLGFNDAAMQDAVIEHLTKTDDLEQTMQQYQFQIAMSLMTLDDKDAAKLLDEYKTAAKDYQKKRDEAEAELEKKIEYSTKPKLEMGLRLIGAIGDNSSARNMFYLKE